MTAVAKTDFEVDEQRIPCNVTGGCYFLFFIYLRNRTTDSMRVRLRKVYGDIVSFYKDKGETRRWGQEQIRIIGDRVLNT